MIKKKKNFPDRSGVLKKKKQTLVTANQHKSSLIWKIWNFHPGLKFHLVLAKGLIIWRFSSPVEISTCYTQLKKIAIIWESKKAKPEAWQKQIKTELAAVNKKSKFVILQRVNAIPLLLLQILVAIENYPYSRMRILHMNFQILVNILQDS